MLIPDEKGLNQALLPDIFRNRQAEETVTAGKRASPNSFSAFATFSLEMSYHHTHTHVRAETRVIVLRFMRRHSKSVFSITPLREKLLARRQGVEGNPIQ